MTRVQLKFRKLHPDAVLPAYAHSSSEDAGMDLRALEDVVLLPNVPTLVRTGIAIELPPGYEGQIRSRSGLALKAGVYVFNQPATIDPSYRGPLGIILLWNGHGDSLISFPGPQRLQFPGYQIMAGQRVAQLVIARYEAIEWVESELAESQRGAGGFGSTGNREINGSGESR